MRRPAGKPPTDDPLREAGEVQTTGSKGDCSGAPEEGEAAVRDARLPLVRSTCFEREGPVCAVFVTLNGLN